MLKQYGVISLCRSCCCYVIWTAAHLLCTSGYCPEFKNTLEELQVSSTLFWGLKAATFKGNTEESDWAVSGFTKLI